MLRAADDALDFAAQCCAAAPQSEREADKRADKQHAQDIVIRASPGAEFGNQSGGGAERHAPVGVGNIGQRGEVAVAVAPAQYIDLAIDLLVVHQLAQRETARRRFTGQRQDWRESLRRQRDQHDGLVLRALRICRHLRKRYHPALFVPIGLGSSGLTATGSTHEVYLNVVAQAVTAAAQLYRAHGIEAQETQAQCMGEKLLQRAFKRFYFRTLRRSRTVRDRRRAALHIAPGLHCGKGEGRQAKSLPCRARGRGSLHTALQCGDDGADSHGLLCGIGAGRALDQGLALHGPADQQQIERCDDYRRQEDQQAHEARTAQGIAASAHPKTMVHHVGKQGRAAHCIAARAHRLDIALFVGYLAYFCRGSRLGRSRFRVFLFDKLDHWPTGSPAGLRLPR